MDVLIVDDDADLRAVVRRVLEREGIKVREAPDGAAALAAAASRRPEVVVLDLGLPDIHGLDLLDRLRADAPELLVLVLTGARQESDRVLGLVRGADDYLTKPFSLRELAARVLALGRRVRTSTGAVIEAGRLKLDLRARTLRVDDRVVELPKREFDLLAHLASHPGRAFSREELLHAVWAASTDWLGVATVTEHIRRLRLRIERDPARPELLVTVRGGGYRFDAPDPAPPDPGVAFHDATVTIVGTTIVSATEEAASLLAAGSPADLVGRDLFEFVPPASLEATRARHEQVAAGSWPRPERMVLRRLDGSEVLCDVSSSPVVVDDRHASRVQLWPAAD